MPPRDEDDWVGTPPEGRYTRDRADPGFWQRQWQPAAAGAILFVLVVIVLILALGSSPQGRSPARWAGRR